jgi:hypothetical protein
MVAKMRGKGIMHYLRRIVLLVVATLAVAVPEPCPGAAFGYAPSTNVPFQNPGTPLDKFLALLVSNSQSSGLAPAATDTSTSDLALLVSASQPYGLMLAASETSNLNPAYRPATLFNYDAREDLSEMGDVVRHRRFIKILVIVFICGAVVRFFSSPPFLNFINDALDPKAW